MSYIHLPDNMRLNTLATAQRFSGMTLQSIEKDWWVTTVLRAIQTLPYASSLSLKGGTSLSKCWHLIRRFSEDADIAIDREYLGFTGHLSKTQISDKLRRVACSFVREKMQYDLAKALVAIGVPESEFKVKVNITPISTTDPETIFVEYRQVTPSIKYIAPAVKLEISGRSMSEPVETIAIKSVIDESLPVNSKIAEPEFNIRAVLPQRTFIEKICLLHEEFTKPSADIRVERMSRHMYDLSCMAKTDIVDKALSDRDLFMAVVEHRKTFIGLKGFDYSTLIPGNINIIPPTEELKELWAKDYKDTQLSMIYSEVVPTFQEIMADIEALNERVNHL